MTVVHLARAVLRRGFRAALALSTLGLGACGGPGAEVTGKAGGVSLGESSAVFFGGPFLIIGTDDLTCEDGVAWVRQNYEDGVAPTDTDLAVLQFTWVAGAVSSGLKQIAREASVTAKMLTISDGVFVELDATAGSIVIETLEDEDLAEGTFDGVAFEDGTLSGSFSAEWCLNLREW